MKNTLEITKHEATVILKFFEEYKEILDNCPQFNKENGFIEVDNEKIPYISTYALRKKLQDFCNI